MFTVHKSFFRPSFDFRQGTYTKIQDRSNWFSIMMRISKHKELDISGLRHWCHVWSDSRFQRRPGAPRSASCVYCFQTSSTHNLWSWCLDCHVSSCFDGWWGTHCVTMRAGAEGHRTLEEFWLRFLPYLRFTSCPCPCPRGSVCRNASSRPSPHRNASDQSWQASGRRKSHRPWNA